MDQIEEVLLLIQLPLVHAYVATDFGLHGDWLVVLGEVAFCFSEPILGGLVSFDGCASDQFPRAHIFGHMLEEVSCCDDHECASF